MNHETIQEMLHPLRCDQTPLIGTVETAHQVIQEHQDCNRAVCLPKQGAWEVLVEAGHYLPASQYDAAPPGAWR